MAQAKRKDPIIFTYEGTGKNRERVKGEINAISLDQAKVELRRQGINPIKVKKKPKPLFGESGKKVTPGDIAVFARQMATMMQSGIPLVQSFDIVGNGSDNPNMRKLIFDIKATVESGGGLANALSKHPEHFDDLFVNLVAAGEQSGSLESLLDKVATYKEKSESIKKKIKKALTYPIAVIVVAFIVTVILLIFVVPTFEDMFSSFGASLPGFTQMVVNMSRWMQANWYMLFAAIGAGIYAFSTAKQRSEKFRDALDRFALKLPIVGDLVNKTAIARFARTLSTMFAAGVPLIEAMDSVADASGNVVYRTAIKRMKDDVSTGTQLNASMRQFSHVFPNMVIQMVGIGEDSGNLDAMLSKVADVYEEEVDNLVDSMSSLMEPMIMAFLGVVVGGLVIAMYLPIFSMGSAIG